MDGLLQALLISAFTAGLLGGVHCAAMCGGIVGAVCRLPAHGPKSPVWWRYVAAYNGGRVLSYIAAGALAGGLGAAGLALRGTPLAQQWLGFMMGATLLFMGLYVAGWQRLARGLEFAGAALWRRIEPWSGRFLPVDSIPRAAGLGLLWGWLPCGMVYAALLGALATTDPLDGGLVMAAFGLGTLPNLVAISLGIGWVRALGRSRVARAVLGALIAGGGIIAMLKAAQHATM